MTTPFTKPPTTYSEQVSILQQRGMIVDDVNEAEFYLRHLNYYRLSAYWLPFETDSGSHALRGNQVVARCATYPACSVWSVDLARRACTAFPRGAWDRGAEGCEP